MTTLQTETKPVDEFTISVLTNLHDSLKWVLTILMSGAAAQAAIDRAAASLRQLNNPDQIAVQIARLQADSAIESKRQVEFQWDQIKDKPVGGLPRDILQSQLAQAAMAAQIAEYERCTRRTIAGSFKLYRDFIALPGGLAPGLTTQEPLDLKRRRFEVRQLVMLQKITVAADTNDYARTGISLFGGHGVMEDFSIFPRMLRDGLVNELWEGPRNVLLTQMHRDFQRVAEWYPADEFVASVLRGADPSLVGEFSREIRELLSIPHLFEMNERTLEICSRWDDFCGRLFHAYQDLALAEAETAAEAGEYAAKTAAGR
jgi:hypothetical protein